MFTIEELGIIIHDERWVHKHNRIIGELPIDDLI